MTLTVGTRLGPYEIAAALGAGGMGEVYRARDTRLERTVAIKVLAPEVAADPERRARFEREAKAIAALSHPHICTLHDIGHDGDTAYLVMELVEGQTLAERLARGPLPIAEALRIGSDLASALDAAHKHGIVHRDVKPANVMLTKGGAKLLDFGLAKLRARAPVALGGVAQTTTTAAPGTAEGSILGTVHYMAPEQVEGKEADQRADIWALGAVLYEMVTGARPFVGDTAASVIGAILKDAPAPIARRQPLSPAALDAIVAGCLAKDPDERWQSVADVGRQLRGVAAAPAAAAGDAAGSGAPVQTGSRARAVVAAALVSAAVAAGATFSYLSWRGSAPPEAGSERLTTALVPPEQFRVTGAIALSPDAHWFAFVAQGPEGPPGLWVQSLATGAARLLAESADPLYPFWSPAGDALGFFADGKLKTIPLAGGSPRVLAAAPNGRGGTWGADGTILFVPEPNNAIFRVPAAGGTSSRVTSVDGANSEVAHRFPQFLDNDRFIYTIQAGKPDVAGVYVASLTAGRLARLVPQYSNAVATMGHLLYMDNGAIVARTFDPRGTTVGPPVEVATPVAAGGFGYSAFSVAGSLLAYLPRTGSGAASVSRWFDRHGTPLGLLGEGSMLAELDTFYPTPSPSGRRVAVGAFQTQNADLWLVDTNRNTSSRFTTATGPDVNPVWSSDETTLYYGSRLTGPYDIFRQSVVSPGSGQRLTNSAVSLQPTDITRDDQTLLVTKTDPQTQADMMTMPAAGGSLQPLLVTPFNEYAARLSPDNQWLAYTSDESGRPEVYVQRFPSGRDRATLSSSGGAHPQWRADGRELFYLGADRRIYAVSVTSTPALTLGRPAKVFDVPVDTTVGSMQASHFASSGDGQRFLLTVSAVTQTSVTVVQNWTSGRGGPSAP